MAISKDDVKDLKLKEINDLKLLLAQHENEIKQEELDLYIEEVKDLAFSKGLEFSDIFKVIVKKPKIVHPPVYRNPENASQTWSGVGAPVKWVKEWVLANGEDLTPILINKSEAKSDKEYLEQKQKDSILAYKKKKEDKEAKGKEDTEKSDDDTEEQKKTKPKKQKA